MRRLYHTLLTFFILTTLFSGSIYGGSWIEMKKKVVQDDTAQINLYTRLSLNSKDLTLMRSYIDSAELICHEKNLEIPAFLHLARARYFLYTNDIKHASQEGLMAKNLALYKDEIDVIIKSMIFLGEYNLKIGFINEGIEYFNKGINYAEKEHLKGYISSCYRGISEAYKSLGKIREYRLALENLISAAKKENDTMNLESGYLSLGTSYTNIEPDHSKADSLLRLSIGLSVISGDTVFISRSYANLGWNFYLQEKYDSSIIAYNKSLTFSLPADINTDAANSYGNLGTIYRDLGDPDLALKYYKQSIKQAEKTNDIYNLQWVYDDMSQMYLRKRDTANAYNAFVLYKKYNDAYIKLSNTQGFSEAKIRYEADTQDKELQLLSLRVNNQRWLIYGSTALFILSIAVFILLLSRARINSRRNLSEMNRRIAEITQANLRQQMNPHFIFNTLNSIQYYMYRHDKLATNEYLTKFSNLMRKVLENSQHTSIPLQDELDALNLYLELEKIRFKDKFDYEINVDEEIDTIMYKVPTMLIQPYVENSICHGLIPAEERGMIKIDLALNKNYISCVIEDNGIGREAAQQMKSVNGSHNSIGTRIVSSRLELVNSLYGTNLKTIYTDLKKSNGEPVGTRVEIHIPILT